MTKAELIAKVAADAGIEKKNADKAVNAALEAITAALVNGEKVSLIGFGTFEVRERAARSSINPSNGEKIEIAAHKLPAFKAGKALKDAIDA